MEKKKKDNSGYVKYRKCNHTLDLFRTLHALTHAHTEEVWRSGKENGANVMISFARNNAMKGCLRLLPTARIMNTNREQSCTNSFHQNYTMNGCLRFLPTVRMINTNREQNCTNNFNSNVEKLKVQKSIHNKFFPQLTKSHGGSHVKQTFHNWNIHVSILQHSFGIGVYPYC
jgi:hypothetical protein